MTASEWVELSDGRLITPHKTPEELREMSREDLEECTITALLHWAFMRDQEMNDDLQSYWVDDAKNYAWELFSRSGKE